ncbi:MAG TPA: preprotein translocase subunit SecA [Gemmatimonadales bacterium]|jgi:preprotein translocase subunit SecA|nr:preprotein translocase subunit SecA [Gemmatimonadales bacterium]
MIKNLVTAVIGTRHERDVKKFRPVVEQIKAHEAVLAGLDEAALQGQTAKFRGLIEERTGELRRRLDEAKAAKRDSADPAARDRLEKETADLDDQYRKAVAAVLGDLLPEAFATVREACRRLLGTTVVVTGHELTWDMVPYDVQLIGGMVLHQGRIAEMATGEGKTLVATLPLYLNALTRRGCHLVTVNNYLARRDSQWMGHLYRYLGLTVACLDDTEPQSAERRAAYMADITYGTNNEYGFDYLRDNMVFTLDQRVQREHIYAIIDEVDSILIDEARTPLIISGPVGHAEDDKYQQFNRQVLELVRKQNTVASELLAEAEQLLEDPKRLHDAGVLLYQAQLGTPKNRKLLKVLNEPGTKQMVQKVELEAIADRKLPMRQQKLRDIEDVLYFVLDEKGHSVHLTDRGAEAMSPDDPQLFIVPDISEEIHRVDTDSSLSAEERVRARAELEASYAAKSEKLHIIHKLLQAHALYEKDVDYLVQEGQVLIVDEYTGRVLPGRRWSDGLHQAVEAKEGVQVKGETQTFATITIQNYFRMYEKLSGMTGTAETEESEFFQIYGLEVNVVPTNRPVKRLDQPDRIYKTRREKYNAILDEVERLNGLGLPTLIGTVNVDVSETLSKMLKRRGLRHEVLNAKYHQREAEIVAQAGQAGSITIATNMAGRGTDIKLGKTLDLAAAEAGLQIVGTERHESRRIDRQLRGRSGRQGDPGQSIFFLSLEDDLMRLFGSERIAAWMDKSGAEEGEVITGRLVSRAIETAQKRVELQNFQSRKRLLEYDDVMNQQREVVYSMRLFALERGEQVKAEATRMIEGALGRHVQKFLGNAEKPEDYDRQGLHKSLLLEFLVNAEAVQDAEATPDLDAIVTAVEQEGAATFQRKLAYLRDFGQKLGIPDVDAQLLAQVMLSVLDDKWKDHLYDLDQLRNAIHYRGWGQKDPLVEYKKEAYEMFEDLMGDVQTTFTERFLKVQVQAEPPRRPAPPPPPPAQDSTDELFMKRAPAPPPVQTSAGRLDGGGGVPEVGRNDPCPCGSGKKYKKCHGAGK